MALILAIEPDRRQAARISSLGRGTLDAEVLVADSTERGVAALHGRHPDLILTSLLLSPKDEAGLRNFEDGGVPVPTLMIPVLSGVSRSHEGGGLLARLQRKSAASSSHEGCDPKVFAAQIAEYLSRIREERESREADEESSFQAIKALAPVVAAGPPLDVEATAATTEEEFIEAEPASESHPVTEVASILENESLIEAEEIVEPREAAASEQVTELPSRVPTIEAFALTPSLETRLAARGPVETDWEEIVIDEDEDSAHRMEMDDDATIELAGDLDLQAFVDELKATYADLFPIQEVQRAQTGPGLLESEPIALMGAEGVETNERVARLAVAHELTRGTLWPSLEGIAAEDAPVYDEFVADFVAAMDEPDRPRGGDADSDLWMPLSAAPGLAWPRLESACAKNPHQDEWGFYDPDKCGLSAVVAKLDQVTR